VPGASEQVNRVVVVGGGQAGFSAIKALRDNGFAGDISLIAAEAHPPYERPPLSKGVLTGERGIRTTYLTTPVQLQEWGVSYYPNARVTRILRQQREVKLEDGALLPYDRLLLATGARARPIDLPGCSLNGIHTLRTIEDAERLRVDLSRSSTVLVIGGGLIGLEVAASVRRLGKQAIVLEREPQLCSRVIPPDISAFLNSLHSEEGNDVRCSSGVLKLGGPDRVTCAHLTNGERVDCDTVVAGIGAVPNDELAYEAGLAVSNGVVVDEYGQSSDPAIYAAGDVARFVGQDAESAQRFESWGNAQNRTVSVAAAMLGQRMPWKEPAWFWTDQFDVNLQVLGDPCASEVCITRGYASERKFLNCYLSGSRLVGIVACNEARGLKIMRRYLRDGIAIDRRQLADPAISLDKVGTESFVM
jgi:3-phenylpropionate/trans-cinnamate dioxygenase ferredoxin reductase subunit